MQEYQIYTDVSCGNGFSVGAIVVRQGSKKLDQNTIRLTKNTGALAESEMLSKALEYVKIEIIAGSKITLFSDAADIVGYIKKPGLTKSAHKNFKEKYRETEKLYILDIKYIPRKENIEAHTLCKTQLSELVKNANNTKKKAEHAKTTAPATTKPPEAKPCQFCTDHSVKKEKPLPNEFIAMWLQNGELRAAVNGINGPIKAQITIGYCPVCGKPITTK